MSQRYSAIDPQFFIENREALISQILPGSFCVLHSNDVMPRNGDCFHKYRQQSDFFYLTGIDQEESVLVIHPEINQGNGISTLYLKKTNDIIRVWEGEKFSHAEASLVSGIGKVKWLSDLSSDLKLLEKSHENCYRNIPLEKIESTRLLDRNQRINPFGENSSVGELSLKPILESLRVIKSATEISLIEKACSITKGAFARVLKTVKPGKWEFELEAEISHEFTVKRANGHAYSPIVASGGNSCVLHYIENNSQMNDGDILLLDFGAEYANYASDLSRTIPVNGQYTKRQKEVYNAVLSVFKFAKELMLPGVLFKDIQSGVVEEMTKQLVDLRLISMRELEKQSKGDPLYKKYFMHGIGHFMGMDVHDVGDRNKKLTAGMILTCEPGIYIAEENLGIRIENDILIQKEGNTDLMTSIPIESDEIEGLMH